MILEHTLPDGRVCHVLPLLGGRARLAVVDEPGLTYRFGCVW